MPSQCLAHSQRLPRSVLCPSALSLLTQTPLRIEDWVPGSLHLLVTDSTGWDQMAHRRGTERLLTLAHTCSGLSPCCLTIQLDARHRKLDSKQGFRQPQASSGEISRSVYKGAFNNAITLPRPHGAVVTFCVREVTTLNCCAEQRPRIGLAPSPWNTCISWQRWHTRIGRTDGLMQKRPRRPL